MKETFAGNAGRRTVDYQILQDLFYAVGRGIIYLVRAQNFAKTNIFWTGVSQVPGDQCCW